MAKGKVGAPGLTTRNTKLLGAPGIATRSKDATSATRFMTVLVSSFNRIHPVLTAR